MKRLAVLLVLLLITTASSLAAQDNRAWTKDELRALIDRIADGDLDARYRVGVAMLEGTHVQRDESTGLRYLKQAADKDHAPSLLYLSTWYRGYHDQQDADLAYRYLERAIETGDPEAHYRLAQNLQVGSWTRQTQYNFNEREARIHELLRHAAERGHPEAMREMATLYFTGKGVKADDATALGWLRKAADAGSQTANAELGRRLERGEKLPRDIPRALAHYAKALERVETITHLPYYANEAARLHIRMAELIELTDQAQMGKAAEHYLAARDDAKAPQQTRLQAALRLARVLVDYGNADQARNGMNYLETRANQGDMTATCYLAMALHAGRPGMAADAQRSKTWEKQLMQQLDAQGKMPAACKEQGNAQCQPEIDKLVPGICGSAYPEPLE